MNLFRFLASLFFTTYTTTQTFLPLAQTQLYEFCPKDFTNITILRPTGVKSLQLGTFYCPGITLTPIPTITVTQQPLNQPDLTQPAASPSPTQQIATPTLSPSPTPTNSPSPTPTNTPLTTPVHGCTGTIGWWKNHPDIWPVSEMYIGDVLYQKNELINILATAPQGDITYNLVRQLIAAKLSVDIGAVMPYINQKIQEADNLLKVYHLGIPPTNSYVKQQFSDLVTILTNYNNGTLGIPHC